MKRTVLLVITALLLGAIAAAVKITAPLGRAAPAISASRTVGARAVQAAYNKHLKRKILVDGHGMTLYVFAQDPAKVATCYDDKVYHCSRYWPPLLTQGKPIAAAGAKRALVGTVKKRGGKVQVTYAKHPLYRFAGVGATCESRPRQPPDAAPGDVNGQNYGGNGLWWAVSPATGRVVRASPG